MTADVLAVIDVYATGMQWATWIWITCALGLTIAGAWLIVAIGCRVVDSFARANRLVADLATHDPELDAGYQRLRTAIDQTREEEL